MLPGFDNTPKVTDVPSTVLPAEKPTLFTKLTSAQLTTAQPDDAPGTPAQPLTPLVAEAQSKAEVISTPSPVTAAASPLITPHQTQPLPTVAAPVLSAPLGSHEWQQSLSQHISLFTRQGQQSAELRLHPQDLGEVQISSKWMITRRKSRWFHRINTYAPPWKQRFRYCERSWPKVAFS